MKAVLIIAFILETLIGIGVLMSAKSAVHEIYSAIWFVIGTITFVGYAVISEMQKLRAIPVVTESKTGVANTRAASQEEAAQQPMSEQGIMDKLGITFDGDKYAFLEFKYDKLNDAVRYAQKNQVEKRPCKYCKVDIPVVASKCPACGLFT